MPFYRSNPKSGGGGADYDSFYVDIDGEKYSPCSYFVQRYFPNIRGSYSDFNNAITIGDNVFDTSYFFNNSRKFNNTVIMGERVKFATNMFTAVSYFNQPITFKNFLVNCKQAFSECSNLNQPVVIESQVIEDMMGLFDRCGSFNQPINIMFNSNNSVNMSLMFNACYNFNSPVTIINGTNVNASNMFQGCRNYNQPVNITSDIYSCQSILSGLTLFNSRVEFGYNSSKNRRVSFFQAIGYCNNFDNDVTFTDLGDGNIGNYNMGFTGFLRGCPVFNKSITFPNFGFEYNYAFTNCLKLNQPIIIEDCIEGASMEGMFMGCTNFNQVVTIPKNVSFLSNMFANCTGFGNSIYMKGNVARPQLLIVGGMFRNCNKSKRKNIYYNNIYDNRFTLNNTSSVIGANITWTALSSGNGYYNSTHNIYLYNDYEG